MLNKMSNFKKTHYGPFPLLKEGLADAKHTYKWSIKMQQNV